MVETEGCSMVKVGAKGQDKGGMCVRALGNMRNDELGALTERASRANWKADPPCRPKAPGEDRKPLLPGELGGFPRNAQASLGENKAAASRRTPKGTPYVVVLVK